MEYRLSKTLYQQSNSSILLSFALVYSCKDRKVVTLHVKTSPMQRTKLKNLNFLLKEFFHWLLLTQDSRVFQGHLTWLILLSPWSFGLFLPDKLENMAAEKASISQLSLHQWLRPNIIWCIFSPTLCLQPLFRRLVFRFWAIHANLPESITAIFFLSMTKFCAMIFELAEWLVCRFFIFHQAR